MKKLVLLFVIWNLIFPSFLWASNQNLDEAISRQSRYGVNTFYSGESGSYYYWQPSSLMFTDWVTGNEVWVVEWKADHQDIYSKEHNTKAFNANGSKIGFFDWIVGPRTTANPNVGSGHNRWAVNSDGTKMRALEGYGKTVFPFEGFGWANTEDAYYSFGDSYEGTNATSKLYKMTFDSNNVVTGTLHLDMTTTEVINKELLKNGISGDDLWIGAKSIAASSFGLTDPNTDVQSYGFYLISNTGTPSVINAWGVGRGIGNYSGHTNAMEGYWHDAWLFSLSGDWIMGQSHGSDIFQILKTKSGHAPDGGPLYEAWDGDSWGTNEEVRIVSDGGATSVDDPPADNPYQFGYFGHPAIDQWGRYAVIGFSHDNTAWKGTRIFDRSNYTFLSNYVLGGNVYDGNHHSWMGWTDYIVGSHPYKWSDPTGYFPNWVDYIYQNLYTNRYAYTTVWNTVDQRLVDTIPYRGTATNYNAHPRPAQSPDGTKVAYSSYLLNSSESYPHINYVVAYYPYPPQITATTATGGTVTVTFDWRLATTPRGYTTRGWPVEGVNNPPPPREISKFRLWRSADKTTWTPIGLVDHDIFTRYNFSTGVFSGNDYWTITDVPGNGTFYYAITSIETSGLESRALSNIFSITVSGGSGTGSQDTAYPASPGAASNFYSSYSTVNSSLIRHYNVYAKDGSAPTVQQQMRIASISKNACSGGSCSWVDWLGKTDGTTQYKVTPVDTQGNEGTMVTITATHQKSPATAVGQYTLEWNDPVFIPLSIQGITGQGVTLK